MFNVGPVYHENLKSGADIVINQGGTDSGKTYAIIQLLFTIAATTTAPPVDPVITIVSESVPNLKKGAYRIAKAILMNNSVLQQYVVGMPNETDRIFHFKGGWIMEFVGVTDEQNAKQGKRQYLFVNEAQGISYPIFWQMAKRTRIRTYIDYNPTAPFWAHDKLIGTTKAGNDLNATVQLIISDHRHNPFLSDKEHERTENIKDPELWKVYARGRTGKLTGLVFPDWVRIPDKDYPWKEDGFFGGLDFGYTNDPTAGLRTVRIANKIYFHQLCYSPELTPKMMVKILTGVGFTEDVPVYCEHDGNMIRQLRMEGIMAVAARKGAGSINAGILKLKEYEVYYTESSVDLHEELSKYMWMVDPETGRPTNTPTDKFNHLLDAARYAVYSHFYRGE